jgi:hypothetical protein
MSGSRRVGVAEDSARDDRRWHLEDRRDFLLRSLEDLRAERAAGDIGEEDYSALAGRDEGHLAAVLEELAELDRADDEKAQEEPAQREQAQDEERPDEKARPADAPARRRRRPLWRAAVALVALSAGATLLVVHLTTPRLPGQPATGSTPGSVTAELDEAATLVNQGTSTSLGQALALYRDVLRVDPSQPQALAETGYLEWEAGFSAGDVAQERQGRSLIERSLAVEPNDYATHLFLGTIDLEQDHDASAAVGQYRSFLAEHPPKGQVTAAAQLITQAFTEAGQPLPAGFGTAP